MKALCPVSSTADKIVLHVLSLSPVPGSHDNHWSKMFVHACSLWSVLAIMIAEDSKPRQMAIRLHCSATSQTTNFLMACKVGVESILKWASPSAEGIRVSVMNHSRVLLQSFQTHACPHTHTHTHLVNNIGPPDRGHQHTVPVT